METENLLEGSTLILQKGVAFGNISSCYYVEETLGSGVYGEVVKCRKAETGEIVAVKVLRNRCKINCQNEVNILKVLQNVDPHKNNLIRFIDNFTYKDCFCIVFELLDLSLFDFLERQYWTPLRVAEIRPIAQQMLVALNTLKTMGITHTDIKPDNIMLVNHNSQPFRVKLIDYGLASETCKLSVLDMMQVEGYRAPEVQLGLPRDEGIDMWSLGCVLAFLYLGQHLFPTDDEYEALRMIVKLLGLPDIKSCDEGPLVRDFLKLDHSGSGLSWRLKTPHEYERDTGLRIEQTDPFFYTFESLDDLLKNRVGKFNPTEVEDFNSFVDLLKKMLAVNPADRILPEDALNHPFITKEYLSDTSFSSCVTEAREILAGSQLATAHNVTAIGIQKSHLNMMESKQKIHPSIHLLQPLHPPLRDAGSCCLTPASQCERRGTPWMDFQSITGPKQETSTLILDKGVKIIDESIVYQVEDFLGSGGYGEVVKCRKEGTDEMVAVKLFRKNDHLAAVKEVNGYNRLGQMNPHKTNSIQFIDCFIYKDCFCLVFELLDLSLFHLIKQQHWTPLKVSEIRPIAQQMLVTLSTLKSFSIIHADIKPDNIMLVNHNSQPFRVKLIDYGLSKETSELSVFDRMQADGYRAPEVSLGLPRDEGIDMWSLGSTLAFLFLGRHLCPEKEYEALRMILRLLGQPDRTTLDMGVRVTHFFTRYYNEHGHFWRLKIPMNYERTTGIKTLPRDPLYDSLNSLDEFVNLPPEVEGLTELIDIKEFIDLLKKMLAVNPAERILPDEALNHRFITMEHLHDVGNRCYVSKANQLMAGCQLRKPDTVPPNRKMNKTTQPGLIIMPTSDIKSNGSNLQTPETFGEESSDTHVQQDQWGISKILNPLWAVGRFFYRIFKYPSHGSDE